MGKGETRETRETKGTKRRKRRKRKLIPDFVVVSASLSSLNSLLSLLSLWSQNSLLSLLSLSSLNSNFPKFSIPSLPSLPPPLYTLKNGEFIEIYLHTKKKRLPLRRFFACASVLCVYTREVITIEKQINYNKNDEKIFLRGSRVGNFGGSH